jgi:hypothetical protein
MRNLALALLLVAAGTALGATPVDKCTGAKLQAFGKAVDATSQCRADARKKGVAVDAACLAKADAKLHEAFAKAEKNATCPGDAGERASRAASCASSFDGAVDGDGACVAAKI